jgi:hypothetical protein
MKIQNTRLAAAAAVQTFPALTPAMETASYSTFFVVLLGGSLLSLIMSFSLLAGAVYIH